MLLDNNERTVPFREEGERTKKMYEGKFTFKCLLTNLEQVEVALRTDRYNGGSSTLAPAKALISRAVAELEMRIIDYEKCPSWFRDSDYGRHLVDTNILFGLFQEAMKAEKEWGEELAEKADKVEADAEAAKEEKDKDEQVAKEA